MDVFLLDTDSRRFLRHSSVECNQAFCTFSVDMYDPQSFHQKHIRINDGMIISCLKR